MKRLIIMAIAIFSIALSACKKETVEISETSGLKLVQELNNDDYTIEIFTTSGAFQLGYNNVYLRLKNKLTGEYNKEATLSWTPMMQMLTMSHSCPKSDIIKVFNKQTLYNGYLVFQMPENPDEHWKLTINYSIGGIEGSASGKISVPNNTNKNFVRFKGADSVIYILAIIQPQKPEVAVNDFTVGLFKMATMNNFPAVENYTILLDPRMPDMGNHSSPNNISPIYNSANKLYDGKLSLTMTGAWRLNFIVKNSTDNILKGNSVTDINKNSDLYLDIEVK